jgi:GNAT superfamily N-acetyltransferase
MSEPLAVRAYPPTVLDVPPAHLELTWRPLRTEDAPALHALLLAMEVADGAMRRTSLGEVLESLTMPGTDLSTDSLGGFDDGGTLRAYALVELRTGETSLRAQLHGGVEPRWRGRGIGRAVLSWMEGRGRQRLAASGVDAPARLAVMVEETARDQRRLYAAAGFSPVRWYTTMRRDLAEPLPTIPVADDLRLVGWSDPLEEPVRVAHNEAFADHWGSQPITAEAWAHHEAAFAPGWSRVALTSDDEVAGYVISGRYPDDWPVLGYTCGFTDVLGVRRPWRGRGLAAALLVAAMTAYRADGMEYGCLLVDTANPTGAVGLYERLGYVPTHGYVMYSVEI